MSGTITAPQKLSRGVGTLSLVFILFFCTSGGPYTTETLIHSVGPGLGLLILLMVPLVWSVPEVLIVGELASMLPEEGGYYRWVDRAFGRFWAFQNGWLTWMYSLVDMAIYPVLFNQYLRYFVPGLNTQLEWLIALGVIWVPTWINLRGSVRVGRVLNHCRLIRAARVSRALVRERATDQPHPMATVCIRRGTRIRGPGACDLNRTLELHRVGQPLHRAGRS